jgi:hypothetical protein
MGQSACVALRVRTTCDGLIGCGRRFVCSPDVLLLTDHDVIFRFWPYDEYWYQVLDEIEQLFLTKLLC